MFVWSLMIMKITILVTIKMMMFYDNDDDDYVMAIKMSLPAGL